MFYLCSNYFSCRKTYCCTNSRRNCCACCRSCNFCCNLSRNLSCFLCSLFCSLFSDFFLLIFYSLFHCLLCNLLSCLNLLNLSLLCCDCLPFKPCRTSRRSTCYRFRCFIHNSSSLLYFSTTFHMVCCSLCTYNSCIPKCSLLDLNGLVTILYPFTEFRNTSCSISLCLMNGALSI